MRLPLSKRRGRKDDGDGPCPRKNGTTVGTIQEFTLLCGLNLAGTILNSTDVNSLDECADACALTHPKCEGFSLNDGNCEMKGGIDTDKTHEARGFNAAMGLFPSASSNCGKLGSSTTAGDTQFNVFCDNNIDGNDLSQSFAATFQDCLSQCTSRNGCGSVSFDASMNQGFQNCYLKGPAAKSKTVAKTGIDTAIVNNDAAGPAPAPSSSITSAPLIPQSIDPEPETTSGGSFSTIFPTSITSEVVTSIISTASGGVLQTIATTEVVTVAVTQSASPVAASSTAQPEVSITTTKAWVAAPVVGAIAAATVFAVAYVMWGRRRAAAGSPSVFSNKLPFMRSKSNVGSIASATESRPQSKRQSKPQSRDLPFGNTWRME